MTPDDIPRQPDEDEPIKHEADDVLDLIDETVSRITDADVDEHLRKVLDQAGYSRGQHTDPSPRSAMWCPEGENPLRFRLFAADDPLDLIAGESSPYKIGAATGIQAEPWYELIRYTLAIKDSRQEADRIAAKAREKADEALSQAANMVREARERAEQIISEARGKADQIIEDACLRQSRIIDDAYRQRSRILEGASLKGSLIHDTGREVFYATFAPENQSQASPYAAGAACREMIAVPQACAAVTDAGPFQRFADHMGIEVAQHAGAMDDLARPGCIAHIAYGPDEEMNLSAKENKLLAYLVGSPVVLHLKVVYAAGVQPIDNFRWNEITAAGGNENAVALSSGNIEGKKPERLDAEVSKGFQRTAASVAFLLRPGPVYGPDVTKLMKADEVQSVPIPYGIPQLPPIPL